MLGPHAFQRREYKYLIDEATVDRVRRSIAGICAPDRYAPDGKYTIQTLYLDSLRLSVYRAAIEGEPVRHKLRIRGYPDTADAPTFLEVKRRVDDVIAKTRLPVRGDWANQLARGTLLDRIAARDRLAAENFVSRYEASFAGPLLPMVLVRYQREAYVSRIEEYARVTFDRELCFQPKTELSLLPERDHWSSFDDPIAMRVAPARSLVVLELKFPQVVPAWMRRMVQALELRRDAFCKYTRAVDAMLRRPARRVAPS